MGRTHSTKDRVNEMPDTKPDQPTPAGEPLRISTQRVDTLDIRVEGISPLIVSRFDEKAKEMMLAAQQTKTRKAKEPKDPDKEFERRRYKLPDGRDGFPAVGFKGGDRRRRPPVRRHHDDRPQTADLRPRRRRRTARRHRRTLHDARGHRPCRPRRRRPPLPADVLAVDGRAAHRLPAVTAVTRIGDRPRRGRRVRRHRRVATVGTQVPHRHLRPVHDQGATTE